jgi:DNA repair protein RecN (Recombination protein N)
LLRRLRIENLVLIREAELDLAPGLNAITGETGAGKTILAQAVGLLLGLPGDASLVGAGGTEAYVEADLDLPGDVLDSDELASLVELRPQEDDGLLLSRRVFSDGRTRAYAWGRAVAREDVANASERLIAMSGQFEQRRLARASYQLEVLDSFSGDDQLRRRAELRQAWRELAAARRAHRELLDGQETATQRQAELRGLVEDTQGMTVEREDELRAEVTRLRHITEIAEAAATAAAALAPDDGEGAVGQLARAASALAAVGDVATELRQVADELGDAEVAAREASTTVRAYLASLEADPARLDHVEGELGRLADLRRRHSASTTAELLERATAAREELAALDVGIDPVAAAAERLTAAERRTDELAESLSAARHAAATEFAAAVSEELRGLGMGDGEFVVELRGRAPSPTGTDEAAFLIRPNAGLPFAPAAETASGGELSRVALAIAAVGGGETLVFDEIDAGIGGQTAHAVGDALARLARRAQVITITHLPQIASRADRHFSVEKVPGDPTHTRIRELSAEDRASELERMLGGRDFVTTLVEGAEGRS